MKIATRIALFQILIAVLSAALWGCFESPRAGLAALTGGGIGALLTLYAAVKTFSVPAQHAQLAVTNFYRAQVRKFLLAAGLFAVAVKVFGDGFAPVIVTFCLALTIYWFALLWKTSDG